MNWAWQYLDNIKGYWVQFPCTECLRLEFDFQVYLKTGKEEFQKSDIIQGTVDFEKLEM